MKQPLSILVSASCCTLTLAIASNTATAQVTPDGTTNTTVDANGNDFTINNGDRAGGNLFHSFQNFSVPNGGSAFFNNAEAIQNIFSRVTGGNISNIDGLIRANGSANLFLINPAGIIFGEGASLDIGGSFYGSTADSILFEDGEFSATDLDSPPLITINAPIGLSFRDNPGSIVNNSVSGNNSALSVTPGNTLAFLGGEIDFNGGEIIAPGANIFLGGLSASGTINLDENFNPIFPEGVALADVSLSNGAMVDVRADGGGSIAVNAQNLDITGGSQLFAGIADTTNSLEAQAGDINLDVAETITIEGKESGVFNNVGERKVESFINDDGEEDERQVQSPAVGNAGKINVETGSLFITPGAEIGSTVFGRGDGSDITINASKNVDIQGFEDRDLNRVNPTRIFSVLNNEAQGNTGTISISSNSLVVRERAELRTSIGRNTVGEAGDIIVRTNSLTLDKIGRFVASLGREAKGTGGNIVIDAETVTLNEGARLTSELGTRAEGNAGNIEINANTVSLNGFTLKEDSRGGNQPEIEVEVENGARGDAGNIIINSNSLFLSSSDLDSAIDEEADGNAGNIIIKTGLFVLDRTSTIGTSTAAGVRGNAGRVEIDADTVKINEGARIVSNTQGQGNAGTIEINASDSVTISGFGDLLLLNRQEFNDTETEGGSSGLFSSVVGEASGRGGNITISTPNLQISDGAVISANVESEAQGQGGSVLIDADTLEISDGGQIITSSSGLGDSGEINLNIRDSLEIFGSDPNFAQRFQAEERTRVTNDSLTGEIILDGFLTEAEGREAFRFVGIGDESQISGIFAENQGQGDGGVVSIRADSLTIDEGARISASTVSGQGGNITLTVDDVLSLDNNSTISAQATEAASGGNIDIDTDFIVAFPSQFDGNDILASAERGSGGNIDINAQSIFGIEERSASPFTNDIDASSEFGLDGDISISTPDADAIEADVDLPSNLIESEQTVAQACREDGNSENTASLRLLGKGGVPPEPTLPLNSDAIMVDGRVTTPNLQTQYPKIEPIKTQYGDIIPARGVIKTEDGRVLLTAYPTDNIDTRTPLIATNCTTDK